MTMNYCIPLPLLLLYQLYLTPLFNVSTDKFFLQKNMPKQKNKKEKKITRQKMAIENTILFEAAVLGAIIFRFATSVGKGELAGGGRGERV